MRSSGGRRDTTGRRESVVHSHSGLLAPLTKDCVAPRARHPRVQNVLSISPLNLRSDPGGRGNGYYYKTHFMDEDTEAQRG